MPQYYKGASIFLFPSLYEGFGLPVLEAMACGTPVITSNVTSIPEVGGDAVHYVDPKNINSIKKGLEKVLEDKNYQLKLREKGLKQASRFDWHNSINKLKKVFNNI